MSWSLNATSESAIALCDTIHAEEHMPEKLRDMLIAQVQRMEIPAGYAICVRSIGHHDVHYCYGDFKVELTRAV